MKRPDDDVPAPPLKVAALYRFAVIDDVTALRDALWTACADNGVVGSLLIAGEGINGTIAGSDGAVDAVVAVLRGWPGLNDVRVQYSSASSMPFLRLKVEVKQEIVTFRQAGTDPLVRVGTYVAPADWNAVIAREDVVVVDARNDFEVELGTFRGAINPKTTTFVELAAWVDTHLDPARDSTVAMFCTGGIRCEKATSYLLDKGFSRVLHLDGGILSYLAQVPEEASLFDGECFVFDQRVSLGHGLQQGHARICHACYRAVDEATLASPDYEEGVSCPRCIGQYSDAGLASRRERQKQVRLAAARKTRHIGATMPRQGPASSPHK